MEVLRKKSCPLVVPGDPPHPPWFNPFVLSTFVNKLAWLASILQQTFPSSYLMYVVWGGWVCVVYKKHTIVKYVPRLFVHDCTFFTVL